jgi:hypothetical protein
VACRVISSHDAPNRQLHMQHVQQALHAAAMVAGHSVETYQNHKHFNDTHDNILKKWAQQAHHKTRLCKMDAVVLDELYGMQTTKYMIAANLKDNSKLMPHFSQQLLTVASLLRGRVFVSIYESGSSDATPQLLRELQSALDSRGIKNSIITSGKIGRSKGEGYHSWPKSGTRRWSPCIPI